MDSLILAQIGGQATEFGYSGSMKKALEILGLVLLLICALLVAKQVSAQPAPKAKASADAPSATPTPAEIAALIAKEFGPDYKIATDILPLFADLDHDGKQDLVVVASGPNPLMGEGEYHFKTLDPYNASFGFGNPRVTMQFNTHDAPSRFLLVIHGWRNPSRKFVLVNIPFTQLRVGRMMLRKKPVEAIESIDSTGVQGAIYWDGKKYKWEIIGSEADQ